MNAIRQLVGFYDAIRLGNYNYGKDVPWLNLNGNWLEAAGFKIGDQIEINVQQKQLVIRKVRRKRRKTGQGQV